MMGIPLKKKNNSDTEKIKSETSFKENVLEKDKRNVFFLFNFIYHSIIFFSQNYYVHTFFQWIYYHKIVYINRIVNILK